MMFSPIAIVARSCVLPGALSPTAFWDALINGKDLLSGVPDGYWRVPTERILCSPEEWTPGKIWSDRGGYILGFAEVFDATGFGRPANDILELDTQIHWLLHTAREALTELGIYRDGRPLCDRVGLIFGNLGYPTFSLNQYAEALWSGRPEDAPDPRNRFHPGLSGHFAAECLGLTVDTWCLDAACASSLYAFKLACDRLNDHDADVMLAGAVNGCDDLGIHTGFCSLQALSRTGQSRPFHNQADGLVPAEGAALFALVRLEDAIAKGLRILGVIRGIGLSNDGRQGGFLSPNVAGQVSALRQAYATSGLRPQEISYVECHATGTPGGDGVELLALRETFAECGELRIGSHKSNVGHLITAAGAAGLLKILCSFENDELAPNRHVDDLREAAQTPPLRVVTDREPWHAKGPRRAGLNAFGFGGTNAHLIVEEGPAISGAGRRSWHRVAAPVAPAPRTTVAIVGVATSTGDARTTHDFKRLLFGVTTDDQSTTIDTVEIDVRGVSFPPRDLQDALPQQILMLKVTLDAVAGCSLPRDGTGVFVGATCDTAACRWVARSRFTALLPDGAEPLSIGSEPPLSAATVVGCMPNISANRINFQLDLLGPGFTCFAEELSGIRALETAIRMIRHGELTAALVGAVDFAADEIHQSAAGAVLPAGRRTPGDAAVALVLKNLDDAHRDGDTIIAIVDDGEAEDNGTPTLNLRLDEEHPALTPVVGHAHAASGLLVVAATALALQQRLLPRFDAGPAWPWLALSEPRRSVAQITGSGGQNATVQLREADASASPITDHYMIERPKIHTYSGTRDAILRALKGSESATNTGDMRLAFVATDEDYAQVKQKALQRLEGAGLEQSGENEIFFHDGPMGGRIGLFCSSAVAVYPGMGADLYRAFNDLLRERLPMRRPMRLIARAQTQWCDPAATTDSADAFDRIVGARFLSMIHGAVAREVLRLPYNAAMGLSSGETDIMFTIGAADSDQSLCSAEKVLSGKLFGKLLSGEYASVKESWGLPPEAQIDWSMWRVLAPSPLAFEAAELEPWAHVAIVNTPGDMVLAGDRSACLRILKQIGASSFLEIKGYDLAYHVPEVTDAAAHILLQSHSHQLTMPPGVEVYSSARASAYVPSTETYAEAVVAQARGTIDLPALVHQAYQDGIRVFVELGPRNVSAGWIHEILGDQPHLAVSFNRSGVNDLKQIALASAELFAAGVDLDVERWNARMEELATILPESTTTAEYSLTLPGHWDAMVLAVNPGDSGLPRGSIMPAAPPLPPVLSVYDNGDVTEDEAAATVSVSNDERDKAHSDGKFLATTQDAFELQLADSISEQTATFVNHLHHARRGHLKFLELRKRMRLSLLEASANMANHAPKLSDRHPEAPASPATDPGNFVPLPRRGPTGRTFNRVALRIMASGKISQVFGPLFEQQDHYHRQTRLPEPPLLLVDRITGLDAEAGVHGTGTIWTETDVSTDAWYLHQGTMPAGIMVESGQADLTLISYMGTDFQNQSERVYRLLGCQLMYHRGLACVGETLEYQIEVDRHVQHGDVRIFFFNYDCTIGGQLAMTVRRGHAGFFTEEELSHSEGVLWDAETGEFDARCRLDPPAIECERSRFDGGQIRAFFEGRMFDCFGTGFERMQTHSRTPQPGSKRMQFFHEISEFHPTGGPWGRGYLRARWNFRPDDWFLQGHFKNDPCMPGTLMLEGAFQAMAFYMTALGYTLDKDGWRFEPVLHVTYDLRCRGQATPSSKILDCELFVEEVHDGPEPTLFADILGTVDDLKALYCRRLGLRLVPDVPLSDRPEMMAITHWDQRATRLGGLALDYKSLLHCAVGDPARAFGAMAREFQSTRRCPRLPGPPYHFMTRITRLETTPGMPQVGGWVELEYDIPPDAWYFRDGGNGTMPFSILLEANLQPCGWLAVCGGTPFNSPEDLYFRNLDGVGHVYKEVLATSGKLVTRVEMTGCSSFAGTTIVKFTTNCSCDGETVATFETSFGFFTQDDLAQQVGLPPNPDELAAFRQISADETRGDALTEASSADLLHAHDGRLDLLQHVTGYWPEGGKAKLGRLRAERAIDASDWYFKAHFYQDPVQPGSLGIEAMFQLVRALMIRKGFAAKLAHPHFESIAIDHDIRWSYRGQVVPENKVVTIDAELVEVHGEDRGITGIAQASLWVDGLRIYQAQTIPVRLVNDPGEPTPLAPIPTDSLSCRRESTMVFDPNVEHWVLDHRPNFVVPVAPVMWMADTMAKAANDEHPTWRVGRIENLITRRWLVCDQPRELKVRCLAEQTLPNECRVHVELDVWRNAEPAALSRFESVAAADIVLSPAFHTASSTTLELGDPQTAQLPYESKRIFHGHPWQLMTELHVGDSGAWSIVNSKHGSLPFGHLGFPILDMIWHMCELRNIYRWCPSLPPEQIYLPSTIEQLEFFGPIPRDQDIRCEVRVDGFDHDTKRLWLRGAMMWGNSVLLRMRVSELPISKPFPGASENDMYRFVHGQEFLPHLRLSTHAHGVTELDRCVLAAFDALPGTASKVYSVRGGYNRTAGEIAVKEHAAHLWHVHPRCIQADPSLSSARIEGDNRVLYLSVHETSAAIFVRTREDDGPANNGPG